MTNTKSLNYDIIERLFKDSVCLTYYPLHSVSAWLYSKELQKDFEKKHNLSFSRVCSKSSKMWQRRYNVDFHYFSDGTLIHCCGVVSGDDEKLDKIKKILEVRGWEIKRVYSPQTQIEFFYYSEYLRYISEKALVKYTYTDDLYMEKLPSKEDFVAECFANGNVLLNASKDGKIPSQSRDVMALFADGRYYVVKYDRNTPEGIRIDNQITHIRTDYLSSYYYSEEETIPQDYMDALYKEAEKYDWYATKEETDRKLHTHITVDELKKMNKYVDSLFAGRTCLTVVNPNMDDFMFKHPDRQQYAVFSDGLVVAVDLDENNKLFVKALKKAFPKLKFYFEKVPDYYIRQLYRRLPVFQKSATSIYIEMLKQKARQLKRITKLTHVEALETVAKISGWKNWRSVKIDNEVDARQLIDEEKRRKEMLGIKKEYKRYLQQNS